MQENNWMTVGKLARKMNVTVRTLQYYDKEGILKPSHQSEGGRRMYDSKDIVKLHQILSLKFLGFSLVEIRKSLISWDSPEDVLTTLAKHRSMIYEKIEDLEQIMDTNETLEHEVGQMDKIDYNKYAGIIHPTQAIKSNSKII